MAAQPSNPLRLESDEVAQIVLGVLLERYPALLSVDELRAELPDPNSPQRLPDSSLHDAIDELERLGLVHVLDRFVFASYRAVRAQQLGV